LPSAVTDHALDGFIFGATVDGVDYASG